MSHNHDVISTLFGPDEEIEVDRALAELRAGRPIRVTADTSGILALPVEGLDDERLAAFRALCGPVAPRLVVTSRRARAIGLTTASTPMALSIPEGLSADALLSAVADAKANQVFDSEPAGPAADAAIDLVKLAHGLPALLAADLSKVMMNGHDRSVSSVKAAAVKRFRSVVIESLIIAGEAYVPLAEATRTRFVIFRDITGNTSVAVVIGEPDASAPVPVRLHSACLTGDVFGSRRCDCGDQLRLAVKHMGANGGGVVLYLAQEGRGLGLVNKMRAYRLQEAGLDTIDANTTLGFDDDERDYGIAARMLEMLGITSVNLMTNNPAKLEGLAREGIDIASRMPLHAPINADNRRYLTAKASRAGHQLDHLVAALGERAGA
jgi:GTP cyclohydrolase II